MFPKEISDEVARLQEKIGMVYALVEPLAAAKEALEVAGLASDWAGIDIYSSAGSPYITVTARANAFQQVGDFGKALHKHGLRLRSQENQGKSKRVDYDGPITLHAYFEDNATCRWVKVGEKTVDVLELQCEGGEND